MRTFHYRTFPSVFLALFFYVWSIPWMIAVVYSWKTGNVTINDRPATPTEAQVFLTFAGIVGIGVLAAATRLLMTVIFERIEIDGSNVRWIDWRGRERANVPLSMVGDVDQYVARRGGTAAKVSIPNDEIKFTSGISDYAVLKRILANKSAAPDRLPSNPGELARIVGETKTYRYRGSYLHLFSFLWLGALGYIMWWPLMAALKGTPFQSEGPWLFLGIGSLFALPGIWMQLTGWVERITLGPSGIRWVDWKGTVRVDAALHEIIDFDASSDSEGPSMGTISTTKGAIAFNSYLRGSGHLVVTIKQLLRAQERH